MNINAVVLDVKCLMHNIPSLSQTVRVKHDGSGVQPSSKSQPNGALRSLLYDSCLSQLVLRSTTVSSMSRLRGPCQARSDGT